MRTVQKPLHNFIREIIEKESIDLIHLNNRPDRDLAGVFAAESKGIPCISHLRSFRIKNFRAMAASYCNKVVDKFIANSKFTAERWREEGVDENKTKVIYNGISQISVEPENLSRWGIEAKSPVLICVGRLIELKGHEVLIKAFNQFLSENKHPSAHLLIVGDGPRRKKLNKLVSQLSLNAHVTFTGYVEDACPLIAASDILVHPSREEAFGRVLLEAMILETPVIASNAGALPEIIEDGHNGLIFEVDNSEDLLKKISLIYNNKNLTDSLKNNALKTVHNRYTITKNVDELEHLYQKLFSCVLSENY